MKITLIGGDNRQMWLARLLKADGHEVTTVALGESELSGAIDAEADAVILPLPALNSAGNINTPLEFGDLTLEEAAKSVPPTALVFAGKLPAERASLFPQGVTDYFLREELTIRNADITAEGAVQLLMEDSPKAVRDMSVVIVGAGRIGLLLARKLRALGADVTVTARKYEDFSKIALADCKYAHTERLYEVVSGKDAVINTVPARIIGAEELKRLDNTALLLDLASAPGGFSIGEASEMGLRAVKAASLPGKCAPESAAAAIRDTIYNILNERKCENE